MCGYAALAAGAGYVGSAISTASPYIAAAAAVGTAYQQVQEGKYQEGVAKYNARLAEDEAQRTRNAATEEEGKRRRITAELLAKQTAQLGASGVSLNSGSALQLQTDTIELGEVDALRIRDTGDQQFNASQSEARLTRSQGDNARSDSTLRATNTLFGGAADLANTGVADKWFTPESAAVTTGGLGSSVPKEQQRGF